MQAVLKQDNLVGTLAMSRSALAELDLWRLFSTMTKIGSVTLPNKLFNLNVRTVGCLEFVI